MNRESLMKVIKMLKEGVINEEEAADLIEMSLLTFILNEVMPCLFQKNSNLMLPIIL